MKPHKPELVSALIDGELKGLRLWLAKRHVGSCPICAAEFRQIQRMRELLAANPVQPKMSDSPEFFWSKVKRDIQANASQRMNVPVPRLSLADWIDQRREVLIGSASAAVAVLAVVVVISLPRTATQRMANLHTVIPHASATEFDADDDTTVIWVTGLPWTKDMNEMQTVYATLDS